MTPVALADGPMDLSMKTRRKLRLEEFLRQNLDQAPARRVIQWVDRERGIFRILWTHQSSGAFTQDDAALFRYWALARGKAANLSSVELKQSLRMALNKSPSVERMNATHDEYRYFRFTDWENRRSASVYKSLKTMEGLTRRSLRSKPPPLVPIRECKKESPSAGDWSHRYSEVFRVPSGEECNSRPTAASSTSPVFSWPEGEHTGGGIRDHTAGKRLREHLFGDQQGTNESLHAENSIREHLQESQLLRQHLTEGKICKDRSLQNHLLYVPSPSPFQSCGKPRHTLQWMYGPNSIPLQAFEDSRDAPYYQNVPNSSPSQVFEENRDSPYFMYVPNLSPPQTSAETRETPHLVPSSKDFHPKTECENCLSLYGETGGFSNTLVDYNSSSQGRKLSYNGSYPIPRDYPISLINYFNYK